MPDVRHVGRFVFVLACLVAIGARGGHAQELVADRPGFTESSQVVGRAAVQFESGFSYERDGAGSELVREFHVPGSLIRIGLSDRLELRLDSDGYSSENEHGQRATGMADVEAGVKVRLLDEQAAGFECAVIPMVSVPSGSSRFSAGHVVPTVKVAWSRTLPADFDLSGNLNVAANRNGEVASTQYALSASLEHHLAGGLGAFIEAYRTGASTATRGAAWAVTGGMSRRVGGNLQLDFEIGHGMTAAAADWSADVGFAIRTRAKRAR